MRFNVAAIVGFAAPAMALTVTSPKQGDQVDFSKPVDIEWKNVMNDPKHVTIELVNMNGGRGVSKTLAENVSVSEGHYKVDKIWGIPKAEDYQINLISNDEMNTGILGQSQMFNVTKVADKPKPKTSTTTSATDSAPAQTSTTGAAAALAVPAAGSLLTSLFALML